MKAKKRKPASKKAVRGRKMSTSDSGRPPGRDWMEGAEQLYRPIKKPVTLRLDADVLAWFKRHGRGYQTRINRALRGVMMKERKAAG